MRRGYCCIGLDNPKTDANIGGVIRASQIFGVSMVAVSGHRYHRHPADTMAGHKHLPVLSVDELHPVVPFDCVPIAIELIDGAKSLVEFVHPERAFYVFGAEDATLGDRITSWCKAVVFIPTQGCLNLAACVNVVLYDRMAKGKV